MWFRHLDVHHVRNLRHVSLDLCPRLNYFYGENGAGKTALLEAAHLLARGRSFRHHRTADLIEVGKSALTVHARVEDESGIEHRLGVSRFRDGGGELRIDGAPGRKLSQAAALLPLQTMVPSLSDLVFGGPRERRQWLDWGLFHVKHEHLQVLRDYLQAVRQRNAALRSVAAGKLPKEGLEVWTEKVGTLGERVTEARLDYLRELEPGIGEVLAEFAPELRLEVRYRRGWPASEDLRKVLGESAGREVKWGVTQHGPHRADVELRVADLPAGTSLSRGQAKALASALMLAQAALLRRCADRVSIFLIDDIGAELDLPHSERFFRLLSELGTQILATSNSEPQALHRLPRVETAVFHVERGRVIPDSAPR